MNEFAIPTLPGYVSIKEAAELLSISDKRVYQYIMAGRLSAHRIGNILIVPLEEVKQFKPSPSGRVRTKAPAWRSYKSRGTLLLTQIHVQVRAGQQDALVQTLQAIQKGNQYTFPGTVARYVFRENAACTAVHIQLIWKDTEMPDEESRQRHLALFQDALAGVLNWETADVLYAEAIIHT